MRHSNVTYCANICFFAPFTTRTGGVDHTPPAPRTQIANQNLKARAVNEIKFVLIEVKSAAFSLLAARITSTVCVSRAQRSAPFVRFIACHRASDDHMMLGVGNHKHQCIEISTFRVKTQLQLALSVCQHRRCCAVPLAQRLVPPALNIAMVSVYAEGNIGDPSDREISDLRVNFLKLFN